MFDTIITNALLIDGTGAPARHGWLGLRDGLIQGLEYGQAPEHLEAAEQVDAGGDVVSPGFIDLHSHADFSVHGSPAAQSQLAQGVTTVVTGNCGASTFPTRNLDLLRRASAQFDSVFEGDWRDAAGFREATQEHRPGVNLVLQVGHTALRAHAIGMADRPATDEELAAMVREIQNASEQGVRGFSTGLVYAPGSFADPGEIEFLARAAGEAGMLYSTHMRNEAEHLLTAVDEAISTAERAGVRLQISHLKAMGPANHGLTRDALSRIESAVSRGIDVATDMYPYTASSTTLTSRLPAFALDGGPEALMSRLGNRADREAVASGFADRFGRDVDPAGLMLASFGPVQSGEGFSWAVGRSLTEVGDMLSCTPQEAAMRVLEAHGGAVAIVNHAMSEADLETVLAHPLAAVASDGWTLSSAAPGNPHPRSFGTFARVLGKYVRESKLIGLEEAIRKMTSLPASRIGLTDRGMLAVGKAADLVRFDPARVSDRATYTQPKQLAVGVVDVWVGGVRALKGKVLTDVRAGRVL